jgi:hypothetical protein
MSDPEIRGLDRRAVLAAPLALALPAMAAAPVTARRRRC